MKSYYKKIKAGSEEDLALLSQFIQKAGSSLENFRYFASRSFSVLNNHIETALLMQDNNPIAYGHLDVENGSTWLGIAVSEKEKGKGWGLLMMQLLLKAAEEQRCKFICLSVDKTNIPAISLYEKFGFQVEKELSATVYKMIKEFN